MEWRVFFSLVVIIVISVSFVVLLHRKSLERLKVMETRVII